MNKAKWRAFWFLLPAALLFIIFFYWPLLQNLYLSFFSWNMISPTMKYVGQSNYIDILGNKELYKIIGNTVIFVLIMLLFNFCLAVSLFVYPRAPSSAGKNVLSHCFVSAGNFIPGGGKHSVSVDL